MPGSVSQTAQRPEREGRVSVPAAGHAHRLRGQNDHRGREAHRDLPAITTLLDPCEAPARELVRLYHERWEIETAYCELKSTILGGLVLCGRYLAAITQEVWVLLAVYQALRVAVSDTALARPGVDPDRLSFTSALRVARDEVIRATDVITDTAVDLVGRIGMAVLSDLMPAGRVRPGNASLNVRSPSIVPKVETASTGVPIPRHSARES